MLLTSCPEGGAGIMQYSIMHLQNHILQFFEAYRAECSHNGNGTCIFAYLTECRYLRDIHDQCKGDPYHSKS